MTQWQRIAGRKRLLELLIQALIYGAGLLRGRQWRVAESGSNLWGIKLTGGKQRVLSRLWRMHQEHRTRMF